MSEEHIVYCRKAVNHPQYLLGGRSRLHYDLTTLMKDRWFFRIPDLIKTQWPSSDEMCLNNSQRKAAHLALTKRLAVIQSPPGTGKTYVGLKVVETISNNPIRGPFSCYGNNPILVLWEQSNSRCLLYKSCIRPVLGRLFRVLRWNNPHRRRK